ncbi:MAG: 4-hydroxythreonine-4-phosphate dehydrogenase PdxA, partial [Thermodesulfovibrionales bacterium]|nr:4-hydroxythreonine-4-phosphate dehydrogenase PdxA [Thermodesulfovibrionales bacterium]
MNSKIAITIGDPAGIGPEIALKALSLYVNNEIQFSLIGDRVVIEEASKMLGLEDLLQKINIVETGVIKKKGFSKNLPTIEGGIASSSYILKAVELAINGSVDAIITAPISKDALKKAGIKWHGHTE